MDKEVGRIWTLRPFTAEQEEQGRCLASRFDLHPLVARLLVTRGLKDEAETDRFLFGKLADLPNPFFLNEMDRAVERLVVAIQKKEKILFFGDYDVDGITGTAQLVSFFRELGQETEALLPHRMKNGYGLTSSSVEKILAIRPDLLVTIDNGTKSREEVACFRSTGIDTIVIDHHETPAEESRPPTVALLNPKGPNEKFRERNIASAGLVFLVLMALRSRMRERGMTPLPNLKRYLDLASLGTIADIVPLMGTNRLLVKYGLAGIGESARPGLRALMELAQVRSPVNVGSVAFRLAPRINAAGRLADPQIALKLLLAETDSEASPLAQKLEELNRERQKIEESVLREAVDLIEKDQQDRKGLVVAAPGWHLGVVGIVAAKLTERFSRPAVVLSLSEDGTEARGSARTISKIPVYEALKKIEGEMLRFGGHEAAAGMTVAADNLDRFAQKFDESVRKIWDESKERPRLPIDSVVDLSLINTALIKQLTLLEPHGMGNPEPLFMTEAVTLLSPRVVGKVGQGHLKTTLGQGGVRIGAIGFDWGSYLETALKNERHSVAFRPEISEWNGAQNIQLRIKSIVPSI